jgi:hypothetical protein
MGSLSPLAATGIELLGDERPSTVVVVANEAGGGDGTDGARSAGFSNREVAVPTDGFGGRLVGGTVVGDPAAAVGGTFDAGWVGTTRVLVVVELRGLVVDVVVVWRTGAVVVVVGGMVLTGRVGGLPNDGGREAAAAGRIARPKSSPVRRTSRTDHAAVERRHRPRGSMDTQLTTESIDTIGVALYQPDRAATGSGSGSRDFLVNSSSRHAGHEFRSPARPGRAAKWSNDVGRDTPHRREQPANGR